jgi:hypothetical protein
MNGMDTRGERRAGLAGTALLCGAAWGLAEATLGHLLHLLRVPGLPGLVMAPVAVLIMGRAAARSRNAAAVFLAGAVAASFKLFDLLVPGTDLLALSRPIQAILLEALAGAVWVSLKGPSPQGDGTFLASRSRGPGSLLFSLKARP